MNINFNTDLNEEQRAFVDTAHSFANTNIANNAIEWDQNSYFPKEVFKKAAELGFGALYVSENDGGTGLSRLDASLVFEELAYACPSTSAFLTVSFQVF